MRDTNGLYLCDSCGLPVPFEFHVDPQLWHDVTNAKEEVTSYDGGEGYLWFECFVRLAVAKGITNFVLNSVCLL